MYIYRELIGLHPPLLLPCFLSHGEEAPSLPFRMALYIPVFFFLNCCCLRAFVLRISSSGGRVGGCLPLTRAALKIALSKYSPTTPGETLFGKIRLKVEGLKWSRHHPHTHRSWCTSSEETPLDTPVIHFPQRL